MYCLDLESNDPSYNLAIEELLLKNSKDEYLILYINSPSVIIGKHQTCHQEVNTLFVTENNIPVIRRISGGGTVYHDQGNLNFSFIRQCETGKQIDFPKYTKPVIDFLKSIGVDARLEGKNDLRVNGLKISGNAEHVHGNRVLHHGTLLFDASLPMLGNTLRKDKTHYSSRAVASNPSSVINIRELTDCSKISEFKALLLAYLHDTFELISANLPLELKKEAELLAVSKYSKWEWNWAYGPEYTFENSFLVNSIPHFAKLFIKDGIIAESTIDGTFRMGKIAKMLVGQRHMTVDIEQIFRSEGIETDIYNFF